MYRIGILGAESTGKSCLTHKLAEHYSAAFVEEYGREVVERLHGVYGYQDVVGIARRVVEQLGASYLPYPMVFFDTELINLKVWFEVVWGECPRFVEDGLRQYPIDFYLLTHADLPFVADSVRENGDKRDWLEARYRAEIERLGVPYAVVQGTGEERVRCAVGAIDNFLRNHSLKR